MSKIDFNACRTVTTRKDHRCIGCLAMIPAGSKVLKNVGVFEGDFHSDYICNPCEEFLDKHPSWFEDGFGGGDIGEARREELQAAVTESLAEHFKPDPVRAMCNQIRDNVTSDPSFQALQQAHAMQADQPIEWVEVHGRLKL